MWWFRRRWRPRSARSSCAESVRTRRTSSTSSSSAAVQRARASRLMPPPAGWASPSSTAAIFLPVSQSLATKLVHAGVRYLKKAAPGLFSAEDFRRGSAIGALNIIHGAGSTRCIGGHLRVEVTPPEQAKVLWNRLLFRGSPSHCPHFNMPDAHYVLLHGL
jgi:hypothetical protein